MSLRFWRPKNQIEAFAKGLAKEFLSCYGLKERSFLSEVSQLAIEGLVLTLNEFLKEIAPHLAEFVKQGLKYEIEAMNKGV